MFKKTVPLATYKAKFAPNLNISYFKSIKFCRHNLETPMYL